VIGRSSAYGFPIKAVPLGVRVTRQKVVGGDMKRYAYQPGWPGVLKLTRA